MDARSVAVVAQKELYSALKNRWFLLYGAAFAGLALALARLSLGDATAGLAGFGRTAASLVNVVLFIVPLMGLTLGAQSVAAERESGTLATVMAQPLLRRELMAGKYLGLALAMAVALALGFGLAGAVVGWSGQAVVAASYGLLAGFALLLALAMLSVGLLISSASSRSGAATGLALIAWLLFVFFGDLGLLGSAITLRLPVGTLFNLVLVNPLETYKIAAVSAITGSLDVLGPAGVYAVRTYGDALVPLLAVVLVFWAVGGLVMAMLVFERRTLA